MVASWISFGSFAFALDHPSLTAAPTFAKPSSMARDGPPEWAWYLVGVIWLVRILMASDEAWIRLFKRTELYYVFRGVKWLCVWAGVPFLWDRVVARWDRLVASKSMEKVD